MRAIWAVPIIASILILGLISFNEAFAITEDAKLTASDAAEFDQFGLAVSISGDTAIVGARGNDNAGIRTGSAYVFVKSGTTWTQEAKLTASDAFFEGDQFGRSVSIFGDTVIVGSPQNTNAGFIKIGSAYVFVKPATGWAGSLNEDAKLTASDAADGDRFGFGVSISGDTVIVGSPFNKNAGLSTGSAYVFEKPATGWAGSLNEDAKLTTSDGTVGDGFGSFVSISGDTVTVSAEGDDHAGSGPGSAYVFVKPATGWAGSLNEDAKLTTSDGTAGDRFPRFVSISGDTVIMTALGDDDAGTFSGSAYVFEKPATGWAGSLNEDVKLTASDAAEFDIFGSSASISGDTIIVGAAGDDDAAPDFGSAYVFTRSGTTWSEQAKLTVSDAAGFGFFGFSASISGDTVIVGDNFDDHAGPGSGSAYIFEFSPIEVLMEDIEDLVDDGILNNGQGNSLISKLENIIDKLNNGQTSAACNQLDAFINQVSDFINGGTLTSAQGQPLIDAAQNISAATGC